MIEPHGTSLPLSHLTKDIGTPPRTLISLLGEQTHPVLILTVILGGDLERVVLLGTKAVAQWANHAKAAIRHLKPEMDVEIRTTLSSSDWRSVEKEVGNSLARHPNLILDLTGGTKLMMLGAYLAGKARGVPMVYVDTRTKTVHNLTEEENAPPETAWPSVGLAALLLARGFRVAAAKPTPLADDYASMAKSLISSPNIWWDWLKSFHKLQVDAEERTVNLTNEDGFAVRRLPFVELLIKNRLAKLAAKDKLLRFRDNDVWRVFTGGFWLERFVATAALKADIGEVWVNGLCTKVDHSHSGDRQGERQIDHEFDVALVRGTTMYLVSCKSGQNDAKSLDILSNDVRQLCGTFGQGVLVNLKPHSPLMRQRAKDNRLQIWGGQDLTNLEEAFKKWASQ